MNVYHFTPAAQRALAEAAAWSTQGESAAIDAPALLIGLLGEPECRGALMLARHGIDVSSVRARWPNLSPRKVDHARPHGEESIIRFSADIQRSLDAVAQHLPRETVSTMLATEHLLLSLVAGQHDVGQWLRNHRMDPRALDLEISRLYGYSVQIGPLEVQDLEEEPGTTGQGIGKKNQGPGIGRHPAPQKKEESQAIHPDHQSFPVAPDSLSPAPCSLTGIPALRVVDAAANRAREGLRVVEDYVRFVLDDRHLTERLKQIRHRLTTTLEQIPYSDRLAARETQADVGTSVTLPSEQRRADPSHLLAANFARLQEALRSLEEFSKLANPAMATVMERLRYETYTLQRAVETTARSVERLGRARLYVLVDGRSSVIEFETLVRALVEAGVHVIQLRDKQLDDRELIGRGRLLRSLTQGTSTVFIMNDRPDLAVLAQADGVHVGQEELTVKDARTIVGPRRLVGVSTHSLEQARQAVLDGADYLGIGPTFPSGTKHFERFPGLEFVRAVAGEIRMPAFAIGGIGLDNVGQVIAAGLRRVAVSGAIAGVEDPGAVAGELLAILAERP